GHAAQAAADIDCRALGQPRMQALALLAQQILYVALVGLIAGERQIQMLQFTGLQCRLQLVATEEVTGAIALTEQQPIAPLPRQRASPQQRTQPGQTRAVADQNQRAIILRQMEGTVAAHPRQQLAAFGQILGQPAGAQTQAAIGLHRLTNDQLQHAIGGYGSDGVLTRIQRHQRVDQRLGVQPDQMSEAVRQLTFSQGFAQAGRLAIERHRLEALESGMLQPALHSGRDMARTNLEDVAGLPGVLRWRRQTKQE